MRVLLDLSREEAEKLATQLRRHVDAVDDELVHTDSRQLQRELAADASMLRMISARLDRQLAAIDEQDRTLEELFP